MAVGEVAYLLVVCKEGVVIHRLNGDVRGVGGGGGGGLGGGGGIEGGAYDARSMLACAIPRLACIDDD